jgi:hypothetical protein
MATPPRSAETARSAKSCVTGVTATFKYFYVFVVIELAPRTLLHFNVTNDPDCGVDKSTAQRNHTVGPTVRVVVHFLVGNADPGFERPAGWRRPRCWRRPCAAFLSCRR